MLTDGAWDHAAMLSDRPRRYEMAPLAVYGIPPIPTQAEADRRSKWKGGKGSKKSTAIVEDHEHDAPVLSSGCRVQG